MSEYNYLLSLLSKQEYPRGVLFNKLTYRNNIDKFKINILLDEFEKKGWLCDKRYASLYIASCINKYKGLNYIYQATYQKGLDKCLVKSILDSLNIDWKQQCQKMYKKKYANIECIDSIKVHTKATKIFNLPRFQL